MKTLTRYITRWALTTGIRIEDGKYTDCGKYFDARSAGIFVSAREAFETEESAVQEAKRMALAKTARLRKQIARLESPDWAPKIVDARQDDGR